MKILLTEFGDEIITVGKDRRLCSFNADLQNKDILRWIRINLEELNFPRELSESWSCGVSLDGNEIRILGDEDLRILTIGRLNPIL